MTGVMTRAMRDPVLVLRLRRVKRIEDKTTTRRTENGERRRRRRRRMRVVRIMI